MTTEVTRIEVQAETLEEARKQANTMLPKECDMVSEVVISDGKPKNLKAMAETLDLAFAKVEIPNDADILEKKELTIPSEKVITVEALDEQSARVEVQKGIGATELIKDIKLVTAGKKGFLGIGKKPQKFEIVVLLNAVVTVTYKTKAKILITAGPFESFLEQLHDSDEQVRSQAISAFKQKGIEISFQSFKPWNEGLRTWAGNVQAVRGTLELTAKAVGGSAMGIFGGIGQEEIVGFLFEYERNAIAAAFRSKSTSAIRSTIFVWLGRSMVKYEFSMPSQDTVNALAQQMHSEGASAYVTVNCSPRLEREFARIFENNKIQIT